jgi:surface antigen
LGGGAIALLPVLAGVVALAPAAHATSTTLCTGYTACNAAGYTSHGYNDTTNTTMYWRAYAGHNCTNYAAYAETIVYKVPSPPGLMGNASDWGTNALKYGIGTVNTTPTVGSVAWWNATAGMSSSGHVAVVESVGSGTVTVSEDNWGGDFHWRTYPTAGITGFIHFTGQVSPPTAPTTSPSAPTTPPAPTPTPTPTPPAPTPPAPNTSSALSAAGVAAVKAAANGVNLYAIQAAGGSSGTVQVTESSASTGYAATTGPITTQLAATNTGDWTYLVAPYRGDNAPDLYAIRLRGGASNTMEVHVLSAASLYRTFLAHIATAQPALPANTDPQIQLASYAGDNQEDLFVVEDGHTGSGRVEVHVLSAASGFSTFLTHRATALSTGGSGWHFLVGDGIGQGDLVAIHDSGATGSGLTEVHILTEQTGYSAYSLHAAIPLPLNTGFTWRLGQPTGFGTPDLYVLVPDGNSGKTELHTLTAASRYQTFSSHVATVLPPTPSAAWELDLA